MVTICADGETIPPLVIYKGQTFSTNWHQDNILYRSAAHSKKGWTDGVIGRLRLLLVDGHNSHYTMDFLDYAQEHNIQVLCYPSHSTHVYQGLDVVIFAPLKHRWSEERRTFEESACSDSRTCQDGIQKDWSLAIQC